MAKKILVIDDDRLNVKLVVERLKEKGYDSLAANDGEAGLQTTLSEKPDLIILDVEMPGMNGYTFMLEFIKNDEINKIPVIVLTAHDEMQPIFELRGVKDYLIKPINFDLLFEKIGSYL